MTLPVGSQITLYCRGQGTPRPSLMWYAPGGKELSDDVTNASDDVIVTRSRSSLVLRIVYARRHHSGMYACAARNAHGVDMKYYHVLVKGLFCLHCSAQYVFSAP